jgi:Brp/Blh family beta-carotene 15,15'-monooxygenase
MNWLRLQSLAFIAIALAACTYHLGFGLPQGAPILLLLVLSIISLGIPHGALDTLYAGQLFGIRHASQWLLFTVAYLLPVALTLLLWPFWSPFLLALFLVFSVMHFSGDPQPDCPLWLRILYGGVPIVLPALRHGGELQSLFTALVAAGAAAGFAKILSFLALPWLAAFLWGAAQYGRMHRLGAMEMAAVAMLCCVAPPLFSFTLFFCFMHSARHILRSLEAANPPLLTLRQKARRALAASAAPMLGTLLILAFYWHRAASMALEPRLLQTVFVGLAALTFPHAILVDCLSRWGRLTNRTISAISN